MEQNLLEIKDLCLSFKNDETLVSTLHHINLSLREGELVTIVGESGSGKTITVRSILGLLKSPPAIYTNGKVLYKGQDLLTFRKEEWRKIRGKEISMIFQDPMTALNPVFTVGEQMENVYLYQGFKKRPLFFKRPSKKEKKEAKYRSLELLEKMRLPDPEGLLNRYPFELSGGMCQRIVIALALIHTPRLLIADEPGTALDVTVQASINKELQRLVKEEGISMLYITHNLGVAKEMGERTYVMQYGKIVEEGATDDVFLNPQDQYTKDLLSALPKLV
ncbi:ABC transporter ATP-binding protein [Vagococcus elongatus]|uniref:ABC transporter domain-containing protein n=1 Tax=Vagococcus elongatus TaxID=180344 RepID=A0A430AHT9_9ENTE|nr:ABC transporter ATP-binding protein [Vagococcus elongatus]RSU07640.1 hypothetical protein CBF29_13290 [Vagococcus elongatus]